MNKHYIAAPHDIQEKDKKSLPDRTALSKLYPDSSNKEAEKSQQAVLSSSDVANNIRRLFLLIGLSVPLPFIVAVILFGYFEQNIRASNIFFFLPIILLTILIWITVVVWTYQKIATKIRQVGASPAVLLGLHVSCLMLVAQPLCMLVDFLAFPTVEVLVYVLSVVCISILLAWTLLRTVFRRSRFNKRN